VQVPLHDSIGGGGGPGYCMAARGGEARAAEHDVEGPCCTLLTSSAAIAC
jgi:hypothetical protein